MNPQDIESITSTAVSKYELLKTSPFTYFMRAIVAGFFLIVAIMLSNIVAALFYSKNPEVAKLLGALLFPTAIVLIVFIGGELFTGNNMTMAIGAYSKKCTWGAVCKVWIASYIGNFIGSLLLSALFYLTKSNAAILETYYQAIIPAKLSMTPIELLTKGILCNFLVCLAVLTGTRMKTESGKLTIMFLVITTFVIAGFEHSIANMGIFSIAYFILGELPWGDVLQNMLFVTIGNIIGGAVLLAWPLTRMVPPSKKN